MTGGEPPEVRTARQGKDLERDGRVNLKSSRSRHPDAQTCVLDIYQESEATVTRVVGIDHISVRVSDYRKSKAFYSKLFQFLGFQVEAESADTIGWKNGITLFWIAQAEGRRDHSTGDVGLHHYAFRLRNRQDVDELDAYLRTELKAEIVDPAGEYYDDYYAVFFLDPDGIKLEGMKYGERHETTA
jgi:catechol 2,3-dioxygenase-like lactoylglutathione lyase family enzyme